MFPLINNFLISLTLDIIAGLAQRLQVALVEEPLDTADWPWCNVVRHLCGLYHTSAGTDSTERMRGSERLADSRPASSMVEIGRFISDILLLLPRSRSLAIPC